jgi:hypothetical protein
MARAGMAGRQRWQGLSPCTSRSEGEFGATVRTPSLPVYRYRSQAKYVEESVSTTRSRSKGGGFRQQRPFNRARASSSEEQNARVRRSLVPNVAVHFVWERSTWRDPTCPSQSPAHRTGQETAEEQAERGREKMVWPGRSLLLQRTSEMKKQRRRESLPSSCWPEQDVRSEQVCGGGDRPSRPLS